MKNKIIVGLFACGLLGTAISGQCGGCDVVASSAELNEVESADLLLMREEEKLARDVYNAMYELYDQRVFSNIPRAEQRHMESILGLLNTYGLADSAQEKSGIFSNEKLQKLYDELVARGSKSKQEAYLVGALVEEVDIEDILAAMDRTDKADILCIYENLLAGSYRHLNAFVRNYESISGETYTAQQLPQEVVDAILER